MVEEKNTKKSKKTSKSMDRKNAKPKDIDYKNVALLNKFLGRRHNLLPKRYTKLSSKVQRKLTREVKKARQMALLKYTDRH